MKIVKVLGLRLAYAGPSVKGINFQEWSWEVGPLALFVQRDGFGKWGTVLYFGQVRRLTWSQGKGFTSFPW